MEHKLIKFDLQKFADKTKIADVIVLKYLTNMLLNVLLNFLLYINQEL